MDANPAQRRHASFLLVSDDLLAGALAQSRAAEHMHHEDRAGVDALLAGVDSLAGQGVPALVVLLANRDHRRPTRYSLWIELRKVRRLVPCEVLRWVDVR